MDNFLVIAITSPDFFEGESERINSILSNRDAIYVHIRKPNASCGEIETLLKGIKSEFHHRLKLHDHFELLNNYDLGGIHLNSRNSVVHPNAKSISKSLHSLDEIENSDKYDYVFLSPIFDSISKSGYKAAFDLDSLFPVLNGRKVMALGGVTPDKFSYLKSIGFKGAALLGYFFPVSRQ